MEHLNGQKVLLGLSAGINSAALLCYLKEQKIQPSELHLFYGHFKEHSPDSYRFVADCVRLAKNHFDKVIFKIERHSVIEFFEKQNLIPHPANSPCSLRLKIDRMNSYAFENGIMILAGWTKNTLLETH